MKSASLFYSLFLVFTGAALLATFALAGRQPLIVVYIVLGSLLGPSVSGVVADVALLSEMAHAGIILLLFLLGLDMRPSHLAGMLRKTATVGLLSSFMFGVAGCGYAYFLGFTPSEILIVGGTVMFSSTIIGIKLLPTTVLHHKHTGELMVSLLLLQDLLAILVLLLLYNTDDIASGMAPLLTAFAVLPLLVFVAWLAVRYVLLPLMTRYERFHEYIFLLAIGWCLGMAELAHSLGLSAEVGAFIAGIMIANHPIARYIALNLKPLRDFFLILFFFSTGASFDLKLLPEVAVPGMVLAVACLVLKPVVFWSFLRRVSEQSSTALEVGVRLGQNSEFALLIATIATEQGVIGAAASHLIQAATIMTLLVSSYLVVFNYETPIGVSERLYRD